MGKEVIYKVILNFSWYYTLDSSKINNVEITHVNYNRKMGSGLFDLNFILLDSTYENGVLTIDTLETKHIWNGRFDLKD